MRNIAKYKLKSGEDMDGFKTYSVVGLKNAYYIKREGKRDLIQFAGACGLLRSLEHKGYCFLCMTYHSFESNRLPNPSYTVEFSPLYNSDGKMILVKHNADEICAFLHEGGYTDYSTGVVVDAEIHMAPDGWNYMDEFGTEDK